MLGAILAFASAAFFGLNNAATRRGVLTGTVLQGMAITVPLGVPIFIGFALAMGGFQALSNWDVAPFVWMALAGLVHFVIGRFGNYKATQLLGATLSTPVQQLSILVALALAFLFLGETINGANLFGIALILIGPMMLARRRGAVKKAGADKGFEPDYLRGTLWGAVCALGYGTSPLFIVLALGQGATMGDSVGGLLVSYVAATLAVLVFLALSGGRGVVAGMDGRSVRWFLFSALLVALSQLFRYLALAIAPVAVGVPIQRLSVVFRLLFNAAINRQHEVFDSWVIASILLAVLGAVALAGDTSLILGWLGLPEGVIAALSVPLF